MKKLLSHIFLIALVFILSSSAYADDGSRSIDANGVMLTATGYSITPGADGAPRLTIFLSSGNTADAPREVQVESCLVGLWELPVSFSLTLDSWETKESMLVVPLTALSYVDLSASSPEFIQLRFLVHSPDLDEPAIHSDPLLLHIDSLPGIFPQETSQTELFRRFGVRVSTLGVDWDGQDLTSWFLLENNNDFPLVLSGGLSGDCTSSIFGGSVMAHSSAVFRTDILTSERPIAKAYTLSCELEGFADGADREPVPMATFQSQFYLKESRGLWTFLQAGEGEYANDQNYIARIGFRDFSYDQHCTDLSFESSPASLPVRASNLVSLFCCSAYEILAGTEQLHGNHVELPLLLRSFTSESLSLLVKPNNSAIWLPCLTFSSLTSPAGGSCSSVFIFDAGGLAYTDYAQSSQIAHSFSIIICSADDSNRQIGSHTIERTFTSPGLSPLDSFSQDAIRIGSFSLRFLGLDLTDGVSLWMNVQNVSDHDISFGLPQLDGTLNSDPTSFINTGSLLPSQSDSLVLIHSAVLSNDRDIDIFAYHLPILSDLNTLKIFFELDNCPYVLTLLFQPNGNIMLASFA